MGNVEVLRPIYEAIFPSFRRELLRVLRDCSSILDVGCGTSSPVAAMRGRAHLVGIDAHAPAIEDARRRHTHDEYHVGDVIGLRKTFRAKSVECVTAIDLIEHLEKSHGTNLLESMEEIATKRVVVFTPNGFVHQGERDGNPWQIHRSGWSVDEMRARGYRIIGINGWHSLRGECAYVTRKPEMFWIIMSDISQWVVRRWPRNAYQLLCVKSLDGG